MHTPVYTYIRTSAPPPMSRPSGSASPPAAPAKWVPSPPGRHTFKNLTIKAREKDVTIYLLKL